MRSHRPGFSWTRRRGVKKAEQVDDDTYMSFVVLILAGRAYLSSFAFASSFWSRGFGGRGEIFKGEGIATKKLLVQNAKCSKFSNVGLFLNLTQ